VGLVDIKRSDLFEDHVLVIVLAMIEETSLVLNRDIF
jgi:hypothetical protein